MNSPTIAAMVPGLKSHAEHKAASGETDAAQGNSFADVLAGQSPSQPGNSSSDVAAAEPSGKSSQPVDAENDEVQGTPDGVVEEDTDAATVAASTLPQIALEIAVHARDQARVRGGAERASSGKAVELEPARTLPAATQGIAFNASEATERSSENALPAERGRFPSADSIATLPSASAARNDQPDTLNAGQAVSTIGLRPTDSATPASTPTAASTKRMEAAMGKISGNRVSTAASSRVENEPALAAVPLRQQEHTLPGGGEIPLPATSDSQAVAANHAAGLNPLATSAPYSTPGPNSTGALSTGALASVISTPVQQPGWSSDFSRQVVRVATDSQSGTHTVEMRLDPPELGPLRVSISLNDGMASALFVSAHASVRQAVESALPQLSQQLAQAGISLGETHVGDQGQAGFGSESETGRSGTGQRHGAAGDAIVAEAATSPRRVATNALVDTFA